MLLGARAWLLVRSVRCESWPMVTGIILSAKMESHDNQEQGMTYSANLGYDYVVGGTHYDGTRIAFGFMSASPAHAQVILDRFPVGKKVRVPCSPDDAQNSVREPGIHGGTWICFGVGSVFLLAGIMLR